jgi:hypothetical protein
MLATCGPHDNPFEAYGRAKEARLLMDKKNLRKIIRDAKATLRLAKSGKDIDEAAPRIEREIAYLRRRVRHLRAEVKRLNR